MIGWKKFAGAAALTLACAHAWAGPTLSFSAPTGAGDTFGVDVKVADIADLYGYQFSVDFDPALLRLDASTLGDFVTANHYDADPGTIDNAAGMLGYAYGSLFSSTAGASGSGALLHLEFTRLMGGTSTLGFSDVAFLDSGLNDIAVTAVPLDVGAVPEPASLALLAAGGIAALARRRTRTTA